MAAPFGFSIGDFIAAINLSINIASALSTTSTSAARYRGLVSELYVLEKALVGVKNLRSDDLAQTSSSNAYYPPEVEALHRVCYLAASQCQNTIDRLLTKLRPYEGHLATDVTGKKWTNRWRKVQWALLTDGEIDGYRTEIMSHVSSINMILTITQLETSKLQSQRTQDNNMRIVNSIQQGYSNTMSTLTGALGELGLKSENLIETTDAIVRSNSKIFHEVLRTQQIVSPPCGNSEGKPITFIDAYGKETHFYLNFVYSPTILQNWLKDRFKENGYEKIVNMEYAIEDLKTKRQLTLSRDWQTIYPGMCLGMDLIYSGLLHQRQIGKGSNCPTCQEQCAGETDNCIVCHNCGVQFKRIDEVFESSKIQMIEDDPGDSNNKNHELQATNKNKKSSDTTEFSKIQHRFRSWVQCILINKSHMQTFRRFIFQPTRAEIDLAVQRPLYLLERFGCSELPKENLKNLHRMICSEDGQNVPNRQHGLNNLAVALYCLREFETAEKILLGLLEEIHASPLVDLELSASVVCNLVATKVSRDDYQDIKKILINAIHVMEISDVNRQCLEGLAALRSWLATELWGDGQYEEAIVSLETVVNEVDDDMIRTSYENMLECKRNNRFNIEELSSDEDS